MSKICKRCRRPASRSDLVSCDHDGCHGEFIEENEFVTYLSHEDINIVAKRVPKTWAFWWRFLVAMGLILVSIWTLAKYSIMPTMERKVRDFQSNQIQILAINVRKQIALEFEDTRIKQNVNEVASVQAKEMMEKQVAPQVSQFTNDLAKFRSSATTNIADIKEIAYAGLLVTKAMNDDRKAFEELLVLQTSVSPQVKSLIADAINHIVITLVYEAQRRHEMMNVWEGTTNSAIAASLIQYKERYYELLPLHRMFLIHDVYTHNRFPLYDRIEFVVNVAKTDNSLQCLNQACYCLNQISKSNYNILGVPELLDWWEKNKESFHGK